MKLGAFALLGLVVAGCSHDSGKVDSNHLASTAGLPAGWKRIEADDTSVSVGLPPDWSEANQSLSSFNKSVDRAASRNNMGRAGDVAKKQAAAGNIRLMFRCPSKSTAGYATNGVVIVLPANGRSLNDLAEANRKGIAQGATDLKMTDGRLPVGPVVITDYHKPYNMRSGQQIDLRHINYLFIAQGRLYLLGFAVPKGQESVIPETERIAQTINDK